MIFRNNADQFTGLEFAIFRLREGVSEQELISHSNAVDEKFLSEHQDLLGHFLLRGKDGLYADIAIATTQEKAEEFCQMWLHNEVAQQYLELLNHDSVDMSFWSRIT